MTARLITLLLAAGALGAAAQTVSIPGGLRSTLIDAGKLPSTLRLTGSADIRDLEYLATLKVDTLDMRDLRIVGLSIGGKGLRGQNVFDADEIPAYTFINCGANMVHLPSTLRSIGTGAFIDSEIIAIELSDSLRYIGDYAFRGCRSLDNITLPPYVEEVGTGVFSGCGCLRVADMGKSRLRKLPEYMFDGCVRLSQVDIPATVSHIGSFAFAGTVVTSLTVPGPVSADAFALSDMNSLKSSSVQLTNDVPGLYYGDSSLMEVANPPAPIPALAYANCGWLPTESVTRGAGEIGDYALYGLKSTVVTLCEGVTSLGKGVFDNTPGLVAIDCTKLEDNIPQVSEETFANLDKSRIRVKVSVQQMIDLWKSAPYWGEFEVVAELDAIADIAIDGYSVSYADGVVEVTADEVLRSVTAADTSGRILARTDNLGTKSVTLHTGIPSTPILIVTSTTDKGRRCDKLIIK